MRGRKDKARVEGGNTCRLKGQVKLAVGWLRGDCTSYNHILMCELVWKGNARDEMGTVF